MDQQGHSVDGVFENKQVVDQNEINRQIFKAIVTAWGTHLKHGTRGSDL